jgi:LmbE family N-acetylglucosaminyl deacetylase
MKRLWPAALLLLFLSPSDPLADPVWQQYATLDGPVVGQTILVVAAHMDDEALGAGGYVSDAVAAGAEVFIVYVTAGDHSRTALAANRLSFFATAGLSQKAHRRMGEARRAAANVGLDESRLILLGYPDRGLRKMFRRPESTVRSASTGKRSVPYSEAFTLGAPYRLASLEEDLRSVIVELRPDLIIGPVEHDRHPDHKTTARVLRSVLAELEQRPLHIGYLVHATRYRLPVRGSSHLAPPRHLQEEEWLVYSLSDEALDRKREMLSAHRSQQRSPYLFMLFRSLSKQNELFLLHCSGTPPLDDEVPGG